MRNSSGKCYYLIVYQDSDKMIDIALTLNMKLASRWVASISVKTESETTSLYVLTNKTKANNLTCYI